MANDDEGSLALKGVLTRGSSAANPIERFPHNPTALFHRCGSAATLDTDARMRVETMKTANEALSQETGRSLAGIFGVPSLKTQS